MITRAKNYTKKKNGQTKPQDKWQKKPIRAKSHKVAYTFTVTKREKGKKYIYIKTEQPNQQTNLPMVISSKYQTKINVKPETNQTQKANPKSTFAPEVHRPNFGMICCLFRYSTDAGYLKFIVEI